MPILSKAARAAAAVALVGAPLLFAGAPAPAIARTTQTTQAEERPSRAGETIVVTGRREGYAAASKPKEAALVSPIVRGVPTDSFIDGLPAFGLTALNDPTSLASAGRIEVLKARALARRLPAA